MVAAVPDIATITADGWLDYSQFHDGQRRAYWSTARFTLVLAGTQAGKALAIDTPLPTPRGRRLMIDLEVGDEVFDERGNPTQVTYVSPIWDDHPCYRLTFDDGTTVIADADHRWVTMSGAQRKNAARRMPPNPSWNARPQCRPTPDTSIVTTAEIAASLVDRRGAANHSVPVIAVGGTRDIGLPIPSYTLGQWLGDGKSDGAVLTTADPSVLDAIRAEGIFVGVAKESNSGKARSYRIGGTIERSRNAAGRYDGVGTLQGALRACGVLSNKHIPPVYFTASYDQRLALIQGLMDADGTFGHSCEYTTVNERLALDVRAMLAGLGIKARVRTKVPTMNGRPCRLAYRVCFTTSIPVFRLKRKASLLPKSTRPDTRRRFVVAADPVPPVPVRCIAVDSPSHQYLCTDSYIPTHNTAVGPPWLLRQIAQRGPGDYMIVAPNFPLMEKKALPEFRRLFRECLRLGDYKLSPVRRFVFSPEGEARLWGVPQSISTQVYFGYGEEPDSLESATIKAAWLDEAGQQKFKRESWDAILRRLSIEEGPILVTTTPYTLGWLSDLHKRRDDPQADLKVVNFSSIANPRFPQSEWERAKRDLPAWKFNMFYRGLFERPAGLIYDCFDDALNICPPFAIPDHWPRFLGLDFGGVNTAGLFIAKELRPETNEPTGRFIGYREYHAGSRTAASHTAALLKDEPRTPTAVGGSRSEQQWRDEFAAAGLPIWPPVVTEVEVGIGRLYGAIQKREFVVFNTLTGFLDQVRSYSRVLDEKGEPTEAIEDKETYHLLDGGRYIASYLWQGLDGLFT